MRHGKHRQRRGRHGHGVFHPSSLPNILTSLWSTFVQLFSFMSPSLVQQCNVALTPLGELRNACCLLLSYLVLTAALNLEGKCERGGGANPREGEEKSSTSKRSLWAKSKGQRQRKRARNERTAVECRPLWLSQTINCGCQHVVVD